MTQKFWLMKSEPDVYSYDDLQKQGRTAWEGVRNYQARNNMMAQKIGDGVLFYHSNAKPSGVIGVARVVREAYPDASQFEPASEYYDPKSKRDQPRWHLVDLAPEIKFPRLISLAELRTIAGLEKMELFTHSRLSVQSVTPEQWQIILAHAGVASNMQTRVHR
jgi:predicted RNA-binding protein with PUA-like domain